MMFYPKLALSLPTNPKITAVVLSPGFSCELQWDSGGLRRGTNDDTMPELAGGKVRLVTTMKKWEEETSQANKEGKIVVVNFSASWCSSCTQFASAYRKLANKYTSILFLTVDVDKLAEFSSTWDINATPTFFFLREGRQLDKCVGANKDELKKKIIAITESSASSSLS